MTLTEAAILVRKVGFWVVVLIVLVIFLRILIGAGAGVFRHFYPKPTPAPAVAFGKLKNYDFSQDKVEKSDGVTFAIKTIEGGLPNLGNQAKVFKVIASAPSILFGEQAREKARKLGFSAQPQILSDRLYVFSDPGIPRRLEIDVISGNFVIINEVSSYPELLEMAGRLDKADAIRIAESFLSQLNIKQLEFSKDRTIVTPLKIEGGNLVVANSLADAQIVRVSYSRTDLEEKPILPLDSDKQNVWVEVTSLREPAKQVFQASYSYYPVDLANSSTYPIKPTETAFEELKSGTGVIIGKKSPEMNIRRVFLAYLETKAPMDFFTPVYVFAGDEAVGIVEAIPVEWFTPQ